MRSKSIVVWAMVAVAILVVCLALVCQVKSCAKQVSTATRGTAGLTKGVYSLLAPASIDQTEPQQPSIVPPGHSAPPSASRRPVFGTPGSEGTRIDITTDEHGAPEDTEKLFIRKDGTVINLGDETLAIRVTKVGPAWIEWDPSLGLCAFVSKDRSEWRPVARQGGYVLDVGGKIKLLDIRPTLGLQVGIPTLYATSGCFGFGADFKLTGMEWASIDVGYFPFVKRMAVGLSLNLP